MREIQKLSKHAIREYGLTTDPITTLWETVDAFTKISHHVTIDLEKVQALAAIIKSDPPATKPWGPPQIKNDPTDDPKPLIEKYIIYDLLASSINYMYWYGRPDIRPNDSQATKMYLILTQCFNSYNGCEPTDPVIPEFFARCLCQDRFPACETRYRHIMELISNSSYKKFIETIFSATQSNFYDMKTLVYIMITCLPNFAQDMFLKRAFLFFGMLNRRHGWFSRIIGDLPVPADYQIPKVLRHYGVLTYGDSLSKKVDKMVHIPSGSEEECEIRAFSILACRQLSEQTGLTMNSIDEWIWGRRKISGWPFHLTITTDY